PKDFEVAAANGRFENLPSFEIFSGTPLEIVPSAKRGGGEWAECGAVFEQQRRRGFELRIVERPQAEPGRGSGIERRPLLMRAGRRPQRVDISAVREQPTRRLMRTDAGHVV